MRAASLEVHAPTFVIVSTAYVVPPPRFAESPYLEIVAGQSHDADAPRLTVITRDAALAARALDLEGSEHRVHIRWRAEPAARRRRLLLEDLTP